MIHLHQPPARAGQTIASYRTERTRSIVPIDGKGRRGYVLRKIMGLLSFSPDINGLHVVVSWKFQLVQYTLMTRTRAAFNEIPFLSLPDFFFPSKTPQIHHAKRIIVEHLRILKSLTLALMFFWLPNKSTHRLVSIKDEGHLICTFSKFSYETFPRLYSNKTFQNISLK